MRVRQSNTSLRGFGRARDDIPEEGEPLPSPPPPAAPTPQLNPGQSLFPGQSLVSRAGTSQLVYQPDGNVALYVSGSPTWATGTAGTESHFLTMEGTGNLALYRNDGVALWNSDTSGNPGAYARLLDAGELQVVSPNGTVLFSSRPAEVPVPPSGFLGNVFGRVLELTKELRAQLDAAKLVIALAAGPLPPPPETGNPLDKLRHSAEVVRWAQHARALAETNPTVRDAFRIIDSLYPPQPDKKGGILGAIAEFGEGVVDGISSAGGAIIRVVGKGIHAVGSAVKFVVGDLPSPDDYEPENLAVTAWTDPLKFALLSGVAALVFPPATLYIAAYVPPNPVGFMAGVAQAFIKGGGERVVTKVLEPVGDYIAEILSTVVDYALNQDAALIRWALRKIAKRLKDGVPKGIILALANAANVVVEAIKNIAALKSEGFYIDVGGAIEKIADRFTGGLQQALKLAGQAIQAGGAAISILLDKGLSGLKEAKDTLLERLIGIPRDFSSLSERAQIEIARAKAAGIATASAIAQNLRQGVSDLAKAAENIPGNLRDLAGTLLSLVGKLSDEVNAFLERLMELAAIPEENQPPAPAPGPGESEAEPDSPAPAPAGGGLAKLLTVGAGGLVGALVGGGPIGAVIGAGAAATLVKD